jgi:hypothetical protein
MEGYSYTGIRKPMNGNLWKLVYCADIATKENFLKWLNEGTDLGI